MTERIGVIDNTALWTFSPAETPIRPTMAYSGDAYTIDELFELAETHDLDYLWVHPAAQPRYGDGYGDAWHVGERDQVGWWMHGYREGGRGRAVVLPARNSSRAGGWWGHAWRETPNAAVLAAALHAFQSVLGLYPYRGPAATGRRLLLAAHHWTDETARAELGLTPAPEPAGSADFELSWLRQLLPEEARALYVHSYDKHGQFLAACSSLRLGSGTWEHQIRPEEDKLGLPGYWRVPRAAYPVHGLRLPSIIPAGDGDLWLPTPLLALAREYLPALQPIEGIYWPRHRRYLEPWYRALRDARSKLATVEGSRLPLWLSPGLAPARSALKPIYTQTIGTLTSRDWHRGTDPLFRPDWRDMLIGLARANILRTVYQAADAAGRYPLAIGADCLYYATDNPDADVFGRELGLNLGDGLGQYGVKDRAVPMREWIGVAAGSLGELQGYLNARRRAEAVPA